jgi:hypothetical protein
LKEFVKDLTEKEVLGPVKGWFYCVEHQKRYLNKEICIFIKFIFSVAFHMSI